MTTNITTYAPDETSAPLAVLEAVADRKHVDPLDLPPLYDVIDPDALEALFDPARGDGTSFRRVEFTYDDYRIAVALEDGTLTVETDTASGSDAGDRTSEFRIN